MKKRIICLSKGIFEIVIFMGFLIPVSGTAQNKSYPLSYYRIKARKIVSQMTLDEKIAQLYGIHNDSMYRIVPGLSRLHIPALTVTNGPAGFGPAGPGHQGKATALPAPLSLAATWDTAAARRYGKIAAEEALAFGNNFLEAPDVNIARTPHNGRTFEGYGEDPFLTAQLGASFIKGAQKEGILANVKHFVGNNQEKKRHKVSANIDERTLREIYLPAFEAAVIEGNVASVMSAYNRLNGIYCSENGHLLNEILRKEWGFKGFITSDFWAVKSTIPTALNGLDVEMPSGDYWGHGLLKAAVQSGRVSERLLDKKLVRRYSTMMRYGVWNPEPATKTIPSGNADIALNLATEGMVLLKNRKNILPLDSENIHSIALIGPFSAKASTGGGGSSQVDPILTIDPIDGILKVVGSQVKISQNKGEHIQQAINLAKTADVVILMLGDRQTEGKDHPITLQGNQNELAEKILAANPNTVIVLKNGSPVLMPWEEKASTILEAWYPGEQDGLAVAKVLFGLVNPSGKLPITFPESENDLPTQSDIQYPGINNEEFYTEGLFVGYRWYDEKNIKPLFPFGFGLSYTSFRYSNLQIENKGKDKRKVIFTIKNTGKRKGTEVAQLYVGMPSTEDAPEPPRQLKGFKRVTLEPGESRQIHFLLDKRSFAYWDVKSHGWEIVPGIFHIYAASSSRDIELKKSIIMK